MYIKLLKRVHHDVAPLKSNLEFLQQYDKTILEQTKRIYHKQMEVEAIIKFLDDFSVKVLTRLDKKESEVKHD